CLLLRKEVFDAVNGLNEVDLAVAYNDVDLCIKVREAGYRNLWTPYAALYHHESISRGADDTPEKRARWLSEYAYMRKTWGELLDSDPAYNPNLTLVHEDYSLR
ncbi:MAG: glycosyltransferase family 2 protein, partial [Halomonas sp.]